VTPLPKPFYDIETGGREYRVWLTADTGYDTAIAASKPIGVNARTSLLWASGASLCDTTAYRGDCSGPRVAQTPSGPLTANPFGSLDTATGRADRTISVAGWAIDPDTSKPIVVHVYVDGAWGGAVTSNLSRPDVAAVVPGYGANHGYSTTLGNMAPGSHRVCTFAINVGPYGDTNPLLGCRDVVVPGDPFGNLDGLSAIAGGVRVTGWAADPDTAASIGVHLYVDGAFAAATTAGIARPDVAAVYGWAGAAHGYDVSLATRGGSHTVCAYGINVGPTGTANTELGCRTVTVDGSPLGTLDAVVAGVGRIDVSGWALDPDTSDATVTVQIDSGAPISVLTDVARPDVAAVLPGRGVQHGFSRQIAAGAGTHEVCATIPNQGATGVARDLGCRSVTVPGGVPIGNLENVNRSGTSARATGWTIDPDVAGPIDVHVYVNGTFAAVGRADAPRPDVGAVFPAYGSDHGIDMTVALPAGPAEVCVFAINVGVGTANPLLGCRVV
jgi:hypothetical protein